MTWVNIPSLFFSHIRSSFHKPSVPCNKCALICLTLRRPSTRAFDVTTSVESAARQIACRTKKYMPCKHRASTQIHNVERHTSTSTCITLEGIKSSHSSANTKAVFKGDYFMHTLTRVQTLYYLNEEHARRVKDSNFEQRFGIFVVNLTSRRFTWIR